MINHEVKGNLAKLLATENLLIEHRTVPTASFDVVRRILTLPIWNMASATVYDLLVGHEVGHALYTSTKDWTSIVNVPKDYVNVVEDARIEKLMKRKFPGLARSFYNGYQELNDNDFFDIVDEDLAKFSLIDRINLHFKIGAYACIPFKGPENKFISMIEVAETFDQVLEICVLINEYVKENKQDTELVQNDESFSAQSYGPASQDQSSTGQETEQKKDSFGSTPENCPNETDKLEDADIPANFGGGLNEEVSRTQRSFDHSTENLTDSRNTGREITYLELPTGIKLENIIVNHDDLEKYCTKYYSNIAAEREKYWGNIFQDSDAEFNRYKVSAQKEVNYLVKEFECRKSADAYARAGQSKTGTLDTSKLHTYKYADDIFKKINIIPDGKNHGLIFILDWSGSMRTSILDTVKQLLNLCWFCRKVQIPFEVYGFTYEWSPSNIPGDHIDTSGLIENYTRKDGALHIHNRFHLLNFLSSLTNSKTFDREAINLWRMAYSFKNTTSYSVPMGLDLSGTPLNESIICLHHIIPMFTKRENTQKVNVVILTDGEANNLPYDVTIRIGTGREYIGVRTICGDCALRDRKTGNVYRSFGHGYNNSPTSILLENLKDNFPEVNLIGFRILSGSEFSSMYRSIYDKRSWEIDDVMKKWRKEKSFEILESSYDSLYLISTSGISEDSQFEVSKNATNTEISKAFRSMLKSKTTNKKILSSFACKVS